MARRSYFYLTVLTVALTGTGAAFGERLGGAYRGPEDVQAAKDTSQNSGGGETQGPEGGARDSSGTGESSGGLGGGSSDSGGSSGGSSGGDGGGSGGSSGGSSPPPSGGSGGGDIGGGSTGGGSTRGGGGSAEKKSGSTGGGGMTRGKAGDSAQDQLLAVSWYFEHNRERLVGEVVAARSRSAKPQRGSVAAALSVTPRESRVRSSVTVEDRERIFDVLKNNRLAAEDVVRDAAVIALGKIGTPDATQLLIQRLEAESQWDIKEDILLALGVARTPEAIVALDATLKSNRGRLHVYALMGLGLTQDAERAGPVVLDYFNANVKRGRQAEDELAAAAMALGALRYGKAEAALIGAVKTKSTPDFVKVYAVQALGRIGTDEARKAIEGQLDQGDEISRAAILALGNFDDANVARLLAGKDGMGRADQLGAGFAAMSLGRILSYLPEADWKKLPDDLRDVAAAPEKNRIKSQYANLALSLFDGGVDQDVRHRYGEELKNAAKLNADVVSSMAMACGVGTVSGMEASLRSIADSAGADPKLRGYAALALGMTGLPKDTAPALRAVYASSDNPDVQRGAVFGLGLVGDRNDVQFLIDVIVKTDKSKPFAHYTRGAAVVALGLIRDGDSVARIQDLLRNPDPLVRAYAVAALGYIADKDQVPVLPTLFEHSNFRAEFRALKIAMRTL